jgi:hypothetical protein
MNGDFTDCGSPWSEDGVHVSAGPNTSCPFALNVCEQYNSVPGDSVAIDVYSPVTQQTYTMNCVRTGDTVTCRGGNNAVVTFNYYPSRKPGAD